MNKTKKSTVKNILICILVITVFHMSYQDEQPDTKSQKATEIEKKIAVNQLKLDEAFYKERYYTANVRILKYCIGNKPQKRICQRRLRFQSKALNDAKAQKNNFSKLISDLEKDLDQELSENLKNKRKLEQEELQKMRNQKILDKFKSKMNEHKRYAQHRIAYFEKWIAYFTWRMNGGRQRWKFSKEWFQHKIDRSTKMKVYFEEKSKFLMMKF